VFRSVLFGETLAQIDQCVGAANMRCLREKRKTKEENRNQNQSLLAEIHFFPFASSVSAMNLKQVKAGLMAVNQGNHFLKPK
jgi:hypothetical protein